jgi:hypothetical protein
LALFSEFADLDGLAYRSRYNNGEICYAIFSRTSASDFAVEPVTPFVNVPDLVDHQMALHGAVFDTSSPIPSFR